MGILRVETTGWSHHRLPWDGLVQSLAERHHADDGVLLIGSVEQTLNTRGAIHEPWVGFLHWCPGTPSYINRLYPDPPYDLDDVLASGAMRASLEHCRGLLTFSAWLRNHVETRVGSLVEVRALKLPTTTFVSDFSPADFLAQDRHELLLLGHWLRNAASFYALDPGPRWTKTWLPGDPRCPTASLLIAQGGRDDGSVTIPEYLSHEVLDERLRSCVVYLDLVAAAANNAVVESIVRATPAIVRRLPATVEYFGTEYPLLTDNPGVDAAEWLRDVSRVIAAHEYLLERRSAIDLTQGALLRGFCDALQAFGTS